MTVISNSSSDPSGRPASGRLHQALRLYRRRIARCRTENQRNRVHIALENYMTPVEVRHFCAALAEDPADSPSRTWIAGLNGFLPTKKIRTVEFERRGLCKGATRYTADTASREQKTLILAFAGHFQRLMVPTPSVLDCFDPALYDVILLRDFARAFFSRGIPGLGDDFFAMLSNLRQAAELDAYRNCIALGSSSGGLPALLAAIVLGLRRGVSIGGMDFAEFAARLERDGLSEAPYAATLASRPEPFPELQLVFCRGHPVDSAAATALHRRIPSNLRDVNCKGHGVIPTKLMRRRLPSFLADVLGQGLEQDSPPVARRPIRPVSADRLPRASFDEQQGAGS